MVFAGVPRSSGAKGGALPQVLGLDRQASAKEIKKAHRRLALVFHPDKQHPAGKEKFLEIQAAFEMLEDPQRKKNYDMFGHPDGPPQGTHGGGGAGGFHGGSGFTAGFHGFPGGFHGGFGAPTAAGWRPPPGGRHFPEPAAGGVPGWPRRPNPPKPAPNPH